MFQRQKWLWKAPGHPANVIRMSLAEPTTHEPRSELARRGFAFVPSACGRSLLEQCGSLSDWNEFAASWNELAPDAYLARHGLYRRRRHAVFTLASDGSSVREKHQPHYQSPRYNPLQGGIERWFEPIATPIGAGPTLSSILHFCANQFGWLSGGVLAWRTEIHQFRIEARADVPGQPTPEGVHRDGVDHVLVLLVKRSNIVSGTTTILSDDGKELGSFTLADPLDMALVEDARVRHGVTPVHALDPALPAYRDVLVVTLLAKAWQQENLSSSG